MKTRPTLIRSLALATTVAAAAFAPALAPVAGAGTSTPLRPGSGDLTADPAGMCLGRVVTIKAGAVPVIGTPGQDVIAGTNGPDVIYGMGGNDLICGFDGDDVIFGDSADARVEDGGLDTINGGMGNDDILGGPRQDFIDGSAGNDDIHGDLPGSPFGFTDNIEGGTGHDDIIGGIGIDNVWGDRKDGGSGNDEIDAVTDDAAGGDFVYAGRGDDVILAEDGSSDHVEGQDGYDICATDAALDTWATCEIVM